jgi:Uma2 family endonuclease
MTTSLRRTTADLAALPQPLDDTRYEIVDGELYVSAQPSWEHQHAAGRVFAALNAWSEQTGLGVAQAAPGISFAGDDNVAPDVVWLSRQRLRTALGADGKLHEAPERAVEVLSPGATNERRDREVKLKLYARRGTDEYWVVDPHRRLVERFRREGPVLRLVETVREQEALRSTVLPGFAVPVASLFFVPAEP